MDRILDGAVRAVSGVHGLERRGPDGRLWRPDPHPGLSTAREAFRALAAAEPALRFEDKDLSVALHFRQAPSAGEAVRDLGARLAAATGLRRQDGDCVVELRTPGPNKGDALAAFMAEPPFAGATPVFIGDDLTDEDAFAAAARARGFGVLVGTLRETAAAWNLRDVPAVMDCLDRLSAGRQTASTTS